MGLVVLDGRAELGRDGRVRVFPDRSGLIMRGIVVRVVGVRYRIIKALFKLLPDALALRLIAAYSGNFRVTERGGKPSA